MAADVRLPVAWVSLDADDDQPRAFLVHMASALQTINPMLGQTLLAQVRLASSSSLSQVALDFCQTKSFALQTRAAG